MPHAHGRNYKGEGSMKDFHFHGGAVAVLFSGISAVVVFNLVRFGAAKLVENPSTEKFGKTLGSLVSFPG
jgi:hypothetical protein